MKTLGGFLIAIGLLVSFAAPKEDREKLTWVLIVALIAVATAVLTQIVPHG